MRGQPATSQCAHTEPSSTLTNGFKKQTHNLPQSLTIIFIAHSEGFISQGRATRVAWTLLVGPHSRSTSRTATKTLSFALSRHLVKRLACPCEIFAIFIYIYSIYVPSKYDTLLAICSRNGMSPHEPILADDVLRDSYLPHFSHGPHFAAKGK